MRSLRLVPFLSSVVALWLMLGPGAAFAGEDDEEEADFGRTGFYIGVGGALTHLMEAEDRIEDEISGRGLGSVDADVKTSYGLNGRGGYRFHTHFAAELEIDWHSPFSADIELGLKDVVTAEVEPLVFTANTKGYLFKDRFQPYAVVGIGLMTADLNIKNSSGFRVAEERFTGFAARFGGGVDLYITEHIVVNAEIRYVLPTGDVKDLDMISLGWALQYRF